MSMPEIEPNPWSGEDLGDPADPDFVGDDFSPATEKDQYPSGIPVTRSLSYSDSHPIQPGEFPLHATYRWRQRDDGGIGPTVENDEETFGD